MNHKSKFLQVSSEYQNYQVQNCSQNQSASLASCEAYRQQTTPNRQHEAVILSETNHALDRSMIPDSLANLRSSQQYLHRMGSENHSKDFSEQQTYTMRGYGQDCPSEMALNDVQSSIKQLENKYIDLANFYKDLVASEQDSTRKLLRKSAPDSIVQTVQAYERYTCMRQQEMAIRENALIKSLIQVKSELDLQMQALSRHVGPQDTNTLQSSPLVPASYRQERADFEEKGPVYDSDTHQFLQLTLKETLEELDKVQVASLHELSTRQYDMFDLAQKNKIPAALRNDFLGHWYDAKQHVSHHLSDLKTKLTLRKQMAEVQFKLQESGAPITDFTLRAKTRQLTTDVEQDASCQLNAVTAEFSRYKELAEKRANKLKTIVLALKVKDQALREQLLTVGSLLEELTVSVDDRLTINFSRSRIQRAATAQGQSQQKRSRISPLDRRIFNYQQSSLHRSTTPNASEQRANSRGNRLSRDGRDSSANKHKRSAIQLRKSLNKGPTNVGSGFYQDHHESEANKEHDLKVIRANLEKYLKAKQSAQQASKQKDRFENELFKQLDLHLGEQLMYLAQGLPNESIQSPQKDQNALEELRDLVNHEKSSFANGLVWSAGISDYNNQNNQHSAASKQKSSLIIEQEPRLLEVKADSEAAHPSAYRYIDEEDQSKSQESMTQVNNVRSQKVQELQDSNDQLFNELRKANEKYLDVRVENNKLKDQVQTLKHSLDQFRSDKNQTQQSRQRPLSSSGGGTYTASRKRSDVPVTPQADVELRKQHDILKTETMQVCNKVKTFMAAMRSLQKAVSRKEPDMNNQKRGFDNAKRELEDSVEQSLHKLHTQVPETNAMTSSAKLKSASQMPTQGAPRDISASRSGGASMRPTSQGLSGISKRSNVPSRKSEEVDHNLNLLQRQVRSLQLEKEKMRELIEELKQTNKIFQSEQEAMEEKLKTKGTQLHKFASQCQANAHKVVMLEQVLGDYKQQIADLETNAEVQRALDSSGCDSIQQMQASLKAKEEQYKVKLDEEVNRIFVNLKIDPHFVALRDELSSQVKLKEKLLDQQFAQLTFRVAEKEEDLKRLKLIFVQKLRELETSFVEISHEVVETDRVTQDVTAKRKQELQTLLEQKLTNGQSNLDKSMEDILSNYDNEETQRQMEELIQANNELLEKNEQLKKQLAERDDAASSGANCGSGSNKQNGTDSLHAEMVIELNEQMDEMKQECDKLKMHLKLANASEAMSKKEIQGLKYDNKRMAMDLKDSKERFEKIKQDYQQQFSTLKQTTVAMKQQLQKEYDARTTNETKYLAAQKQLKIARQENAEQQTEMLLLMKRIEDMHSEQAYLRELRGDYDSDSHDADAPDSQGDSGDKKKENAADQNDTPPSSPEEKKSKRQQRKDEEELREFEERVATDPIDAARYYQRIATVTKQEFKSVKRSHAKALSLESDQQQLNSKLEDLEKERAELQSQVAKSSKGTRLVICLQNYVRKMLQEKLEAKAAELEALGAKTKEATAEATAFREKASQLEQDFETTIKSHGSQMQDLEGNIAEVRKQLQDAENQKQASREEAKRAKEQEAKIALELEEARSPDKKALLASTTASGTLLEEELRSQIQEELEETFLKKQQEMVQTYKQVQRQQSEKHQASLLELETQLAAAQVAAGSTLGSQASIDQLATLKAQMQSEHEAALLELEQLSSKKLKKSERATLLIVCLQNRVREMVASKLKIATKTIQEKEEAFTSLKEDLQDVTQSHNKKVVEMREAFDKEKEEATTSIIAKYEAQMKQFEAKIHEENAKQNQQKEQDEIRALTLSLEEQQAAAEKDRLRTQKHTRIMISLMEFVRKMLIERLEKREADLQLQIVEITNHNDESCQRLKSTQDEFEKFKAEKLREFEEFSTVRDESAKKAGQIDAADAQIQSLKSVQEALEREKDDLLIQNEGMEEELHQARTELLESKGLIEVKDMRIEELEERLNDMQQAIELNRTSELGSSGKVIHQGDDLRELEMGSEGLMEAENNSFRTSGKGSDGKAATPEMSEETITTLKADNADLREQVEKLRQDLDANITAVGGGRNSWDGGSAGRGSWGSDQLTRNREVEEHLKHVRSVMTQFLSKLPVTTRENEDILPVVFSMLNFQSEEITAISEARSLLDDSKNTKKGIFGGRNKKKNK